METSNFTSPLEVVQTISMLSYLNTLSDFLFSEHLLKEEDQFQPIPVVNALYHYFYDSINQTQSNKLKERKIRLARKLIKGTDLYGARRGEKLDTIFVNSLYKHIITSLVFAKFTNIYVFIAEVVLYSDSILVNSIYDNMTSVLSKTRFLNENGFESNLESFAINKIFQDFIRPLFPTTSRNLSLISVDYIFAQAGAIFLYFKENSNVITINFNAGNKTLDSEVEFNKYLTLGNLIEQLVKNGNVNESILQIFALPAILYYVYKEKENLVNESIANIISNSSHWNAAYWLLFSYINGTFAELERDQDKDFRLQFHLALSNFKNRSTLAGEIIQRKCLNVTENNIQDEITKYKNNPDDYKCSTVNISDSFPNINDLYDLQVDNITRKYHAYEIGSVREAFGKELIETINNTQVQINRGYFIRIILPNPLIYNLIDRSTDIFKIQFPNGTIIYCALLRRSNEIILTPISDSLNKFWISLERFDNLGDYSYHLLSTLKKPHETFDNFLDNILLSRVEEFKKSLHNSGYDQTSKEWWIQFGLSLIPFYSCSQAIGNKEVGKALFSCIIDLLIFVPLVGEFGSIGLKFTSITLNTALQLTGTSIMSCLLRRTLQETTILLKNIVVQSTNQMLLTFSKKMFMDLSVSVIRFLDPGFELLYNISKLGFENLIISMKALAKLTKLHFPSLIHGFKKSINAIEGLHKEVGKKFGRTVFVTCSSKKTNGCYGYRYVQLPNKKLIELRTIREFNEKRLVVVNRITMDGKKIYNSIDPVTGLLKETDLHLMDDRPHEFPYNSKAEIGFKSFQDINYCDSLRRRRTPTGKVCLRSNLRRERIENENIAISIMREIPGFKISEGGIRTEIRKYIFPTSYDQNNFVKLWATGRQIPASFNKYKIDDPELFVRLRYSDDVDNEVLDISDAFKRIEATYPKSDFGPTSWTPYLPDEAWYFQNYGLQRTLSFEDYYGIKLYISRMCRMINTNTKSAQSMREALFRLAIRQSDDPIIEFAPTLFRGEERTPEVVKELFFSNKKEFQFNKFTSTSEESRIAELYKFKRSKSDKICVFYEMKFSKSYMRAKVHNVFQSYQLETVLLPGSKFNIDKVEKYTENGKQTVKVRLSFKHNAMSKEEWYKHIMDNLKELKKHGAPFYKMDTPSYMLPKKTTSFK